MKFLLLTTEYPPFKGGVANYYQALKRHWPQPDNFTVWHKVYKSRWLKYIYYFFNIYLKYKRRQFDYLLVGQILPLGTIALFFAQFYRVKYAVFLHGLDFNLAIKNRWKKWLTKNILLKADRIISANSYTAGLVNDFYPLAAKKSLVLNPGIDPNIITTLKLTDFRRQYGLENKVVLLSLGRLVKRKGVDMTIKAIQSLENRLREKIVYVVAGQGSEVNYLKDLAQGDKQIIFLGEIDETAKWSWLASCDIFIMPARNILGDFEGFGIVYLEANLLGKPVIAGRSGGVPDAVENNQNGLLVDPEDVTAITQAITALANNPALREKLGQQGKQRALKDFSWKKQAEVLFTSLD